MHTNIIIQNAENTLLSTQQILGVFYRHLQSLDSSLKNFVSNYSDIKEIRDTISVYKMNSESDKKKEMKYKIIYYILNELTEKNTYHDILIHINSINEILDSLPF